MHTLRLVSVLVLVAASTRIATAQIAFGAGAGAATGPRGGTATTAHAAGFLEFTMPVLPGARAEAMLVKMPRGVGAGALIGSALFTAPIPVITPYALVGWGTYGLGKSAALGGWNIGAGVRASLGVNVFAEYRRHQRIARDLVTVGVRF